MLATLMDERGESPAGMPLPLAAKLAARTFLLVLLLCACGAPAGADTFEWTGAATGAYEDGASWLNATTSTTGAVPTEFDSATFLIDDDLTLAADHLLAELKAVSGTTSIESANTTRYSLGVEQLAGSTDPTVLIDGATAVDTPHLTIGENAALNVFNSTGASKLLVGDLHQGSLTVQGGGSVVSATESIVGVRSTGTGQVLIAGDSSRLSVSQTLTVGASGTGTFTVDAGGDVFPTQMFVASGSGSSGTVNVQGTGSLLSTLLLEVGSQGSADVNVTSNGHLEVNGPLNIKQGGNVMVNGGTLAANNDVSLTGGGNLSGQTAANFLLSTNRTLSATGNSTVEFDAYTIDRATTFDMKSGSTLTAGELHVGNATSNGTLLVNDLGTLVELTSLTTPSLIGSADLGAGLTTVNLANDGLLRASDGGVVLEASASINISSGADLRTSGPFTMQGGKVNLSGKGSMLQLTNGAPLSIGETGTATLTLLASSTLRTSSAGATIGQGGTFTAAGAGPGGDRSFVFIDGPLVVDGGTLQVGNFADLFLIGGTTFVARNGAQVDFGDSQPITAGKTYTVESDASLAADALTIGNGGSLNLTGGSIVATTLDNSQGGTFDFTAGRLSTTQFVGSLLNEGGSLAPGDSPSQADTGITTITDHLVQQAAATLAIDIAGVAPGSQHDQVVVTGNATLAGSLEVSLLEGFEPAPTDTFTLLTASSIAGSFGDAPAGSRILTQQGLGSFQVDYGAGSPFAADDVVLSDFVAIVAGDFNGDGTVDVADYAVWRDNLGASDESALNGNGNGDGVIDTGDYQLWQTYFGLTAPASLRAGASTTPVPEPSTAIMLAALLLAARGVRPKR